MTRHDDNIRLRHMMAYAEEAIEMAAARQRKDLEADRQLNLSLVRLTEIVGEAAARVSAESKSGLPDIPWPEIIGMRNRLIHGYDQVDLDVLWDVVQLDLPRLVMALKKIRGVAEQ